MDPMIDADAALQDDVQSELDWAKDVDAARIGVAVTGGTVSLSGEVDTYAERLAAVRATLRVRGVRAVVDEITVHPTAPESLSEPDLAVRVAHALEVASDVPPGVQATIRGHDVILTGTAEWHHQRRAAERAVQYLRGVHAVDDRIVLSARPSAQDAAARIREALARNSQVDAQNIDVTVTDGTVVLTGTVSSAAEKRQAGYAAWSSPHVGDVRNDLVVSTY